MKKGSQYSGFDVGFKVQKYVHGDHHLAHECLWFGYSLRWAFIVVFTNSLLQLVDAHYIWWGSSA
jgi:hypothetical protein